ncbi:MAG: tRNA epoxyqueuosine(34) reductase QueG, partial [Pseudomonadota bacterium]|nr:tRNA epoxyqueuosine(34) reductase QueG [Pseudomonadota bacterium]
LNSPDKGYISHYALGRDYHKTVRGRLRALAKQIEIHAGGQYRAFTDSAPILEKPLAAKAGIGWVGKNTLILNQRAGSWFFLGEIFTNIPLPINVELQEDKCGTCKACINVCPTGAIVGPKQLDPRRCISYLTIEHKGVIDEELRESIGNRIFGCDDCQLVCPWNRFAQASNELDFVPRHGLDDPTLIGLLAWNEEDFLKHTEGMALRRINYSQWVRNLAIAAGNAQPTPDLIRAAEEKLAESRRKGDTLSSEHLEWAVQKLNPH